MFCIYDSNIENQTAQYIALDVYERLTILHDFTGCVLPIWDSISCCTFEEKNETGFALRIVR